MVNINLYSHIVNNCNIYYLMYLQHLFSVANLTEETSRFTNEDLLGAEQLQNVSIPAVMRRRIVSSVAECSSAYPEVQVQFRAWSHKTGMDYHEAFVMHHISGVVHNFSEAMGDKDFCPLFTKRSKIHLYKEKRATQRMLVTDLYNRWKYTTPGLYVMLFMN